MSTPHILFRRFVFPLWMLPAAFLIGVLLGNSWGRASVRVIGSSEGRYAPIGSSATGATCDLCKGTGRTAHFGHSGDGRSMGQYYVDSYISCPMCNGAGVR